MNRFSPFVVAVLISGCSTRDSSETKVYDSIHRIYFVNEHISGPILSRSKDRVYAVIDSKRTLIFEGYGGNKLALRPLREGLVLIQYCGGGIREVAPFIIESTSGDALAVEVQPIVIPEIEVGGKRVCAE